MSQLRVLRELIEFLLGSFRRLRVVPNFSPIERARFAPLRVASSRARIFPRASRTPARPLDLRKIRDDLQSMLCPPLYCTETQHILHTYSQRYIFFLESRPLNRSETGYDFGCDTFLLFKCKLICSSSGPYRLMVTPNRVFIQRLGCILQNCKMVY